MQWFQKKNDLSNFNLGDDSHSNLVANKANLFVFIISIILIIIFIIGILVSSKKAVNEPSKEISDIENQLDNGENVLAEGEMYIEPTLFINDGVSEIEFSDVTLNTYKQETISLIAENAPLKIEDIYLSDANIEEQGFSISQTCTEKEVLEVGDNCVISLEWLPEQVQERNIFLMID